MEVIKNSSKQYTACRCITFELAENLALSDCQGKVVTVNYLFVISDTSSWTDSVVLNLFQHLTPLRHPELTFASSWTCFRI